jgi:putative SOS response-associated peptidase YedK
MCGRYTLATPVAELSRIFGFPELPNLSPRYNIAPTQDIAAVRLPRDEERRELVLLRWGLVPYWADDPSIGSRMINARSESVAEKPAFRSAFARRRCLVLVDGFYEWQQHGVPKGGKKQPFRIRRRDGQPFAFAGLWESWKGPKGGPALEHPLETATIVTTDANSVLKPLHDRMPVILAPEDYDAWLDSETPKEVAEALLRPCPEEWLEVYPVSTRVNSVRNEDASLVEPLEEEPAAVEKQPRQPRLL